VAEPVRSGRQHSVDTPAGPTRRCYYASDPTGRPDCQLTAVVRYGMIALCADCRQRRSTLGKGQPAEPVNPGRPVDVLDWVRDADTDLRRTERLLVAAVTRARQHGHSWTAIGQRLGVTRQAAQQRFRHRREEPD